MIWWFIELVVPFNKSFLWAHTFILALPFPSSNYPLVRTPINVLLPDFTSPNKSVLIYTLIPIPIFLRVINSTIMPFKPLAALTIVT